MMSGKPLPITKRMVWKAYQSVKGNGEAAGVDGQSLDDFAQDLENNLYKLWNRLASGSYMPPAVRRVEIPKAKTPTMKRELKRRSAIEPMIGHAKNDGRLGRNYLLGTAGDKINAILAAAGNNLRLVLRRLALLFARIPEAILYILAATTAPAA